MGHGHDFTPNLAILLYFKCRKRTSMGSSLPSHPIILQPTIIHRWPISDRANSLLFGLGPVIARPFITMLLPTRKLDMLPTKHIIPTTQIRFETELTGSAKTLPMSLPVSCFFVQSRSRRLCASFFKWGIIHCMVFTNINIDGSS